MTRLYSAPVISAIIYTDGREADAMLRQIADDLASRGVEVAGFVQRGESRSDRARCDMVLEEMASGERVVYRVGEVRVRLGDRERTTVFLAGPPGCRALLGAVTLEEFGLAADPVHQRLFPVPALLV